jgi:hypothetical protein
MPRFSLKSMLIVFVAASLWLSTAAGYTAGTDVRRSVLFLILVASGFAALYLHGKQRAFWAGFFAAMLLCGQETSLSRYAPNFSWLSMYAANYANNTAPPAITYYNPVPSSPYTNSGTVLPPPPASAPQAFPQPYSAPYVSVAPTANPTLPLQFAAIATGWILLLAVASGFVATAVYDFSVAAAKRTSPS